MANKEEIIFKVKAELEGFKKSMADLTKMAKDTSKSVEKAMNMDLSAQGSKAGKTFAKGMNKELKSITDNFQKELRLMSQKTYTIKVKLDSSSLDKVKRELSSIEIRVSASASNRASSSMSNNANAPNAFNSMASVANSAALSTLTNELNSSAGLIKTANDSMKVVNESIKTVNDSMKTVGSKIEETGSQMKATADVVQNSSKSIEAAGNAFKETSAQVKDAGNRMSDVWTKMDSVGNKIESTANSIKNTKLKVDIPDIPDVKVDIPEIKVDIPDVKVEIPDIPDVKVEIPDVKVEVPDIPDINVNVPEIKIDTENIPKIKIDTENVPKVKIDDKNVKLNSIGANLKPIAEKIDNAGNNIKAAGNQMDTAGTKMYAAGNNIHHASTNMISVGTKISAAGTTILSALNKIGNYKIKIDTKDNKIEVDADLIAKKIKEALDESIKKIGPAITDAFNKSIEELKTVKIGIQNTVSESTSSNMANFKGFGLSTKEDNNNLKELNKHLEEAADEINLIRSITSIKGKSFLHGLFGENNAGKFDDVDINLSSLTAHLQTQLSKLKSLTSDFIDIDDILKVDADKLNLPALEKYIKVYTKLQGEIEGCKIASEQLQNIANKYGNLTEYAEVFVKYLGDNQLTFAVANVKELTNGFDELSMTIEDANEEVNNLIMNYKNLQLLSDNFNGFSIFGDTKKLRELQEARKKLSTEYDIFSFTKTPDEVGSYHYVNTLLSMEKEIKHLDKQIKNIQEVISGANQQQKLEGLQEARKNLNDELLAFIDEIDPESFGAVEYIKTINSIQKVVDKLDEEIKDIQDAIEQTSGESTEQLEKRVREQRNQYGKMYRGFGTEDYRKLIDAYEERDNLTKEREAFKNEIKVSDIGADAYRDTLEIIQTALNNLSTTIKTLEGLFHPITAIEAQIEDLTDLLLEFETDPSGVTNKIKQDIKQVFDEIEKQINDLSEEYDEVTQQSLKEWLDSTREIAQKGILKPTSDDIYKKNKEKIKELRDSIKGSFDSDVFEQGHMDVIKGLEDKLDESYKKQKNSEFIKEFKQIINKFEKLVNETSASSDIKQDLKQSLNGIIDRIDNATGKSSNKDTLQEFEAIFKQLADRINSSPVDSLAKELYNNVFNRVKERIDEIYKAREIDLNVNLPMLRADALNEQFDNFRRYMQNSNINLPIRLDDTLKEQFDRLRDYMAHSNINLPIPRDINLPVVQVIELNEQFDNMRRSMQNICEPLIIDMHEAEQATESLRDRLKRLFNQSDAHVFTHKMGELKKSLKELSVSVKDLTQPLKKAFSGVSSIIGKMLSPIKKAVSGFRDMGNEAKIASGKINGLGGSLKGLIGKLGMFFGVYELFGLMKEGTQDAMQYEATVMNLRRTLGEASNTLLDFANTNAVAFGISKKQVAEYGNIFSIVMRDANAAIAGPGASIAAITQNTADMSKQLLESAGIIAGATGYRVEEVLEGIRSGILGSSEAVDQYGLNLKIANLEQSKTFQQVANGAKSWNDLTSAQQQYIIAQEIINQTTAKFGGIMKNTASLHNQFLAQLANTKLALGNLGKAIWTALLPPLTKLLAVLEVVFNYAASAMTALLGMFGIQVDFSSQIGGTDGLESDLGTIEDTVGSATDALDNASDSASNTSDAIGNVGESSKESAKETEEAAKKIKRALAGFDQINVLSFGEDPEKDGEEGPDPEDYIPNWGDLTPDDDFSLLPQLDDSTMSKIEDFADKMKNLLGELIEPLKAAWDLLGDRWIAAWDRLKASFKNFCDALSDFLASVWRNGGKEFVQHMAEIALAVGIAAMEIGGTILNALAELWRHLDPETNMNTQGFIDALNEVSVKLRDLILGLNEHLESLLEHGGQDVLNAMGDCFMNLGEASVRGVGVAIDAIDGLLDHLDPANNEITRTMLEAWENAFLSIGQAALAFADLLESALVNGLQDVINSLGDLAVQILATMGTIVDEIAQAAASLFKHLDPATNEYSAGALEGFRYFVDSIRGFVEMLGESFKTFMDNGGQEFVNNMGDIAAILIDLGATILGDLISAVTNFFNSWAGRVVIETAARTLELLSSIIEGLLAILEKFSPILSAVIAAFAGFVVASKVVNVVTKVITVFKSVGSILGLAKTAASALWAVLAANPIALVVAAVVALGVALVAAYNKFDGFRNAVDGIIDAFSGLFDAIKGALSNILDDVVNIFQDAIDIIVGIFTGDGERVGEAVKNLVTHSLQLLGDLALGAIDIGINLVTGLIQGLWEGIKAIPEAITGVVNFILDFFKGLFGINSPSTVFAGYGVNLIEGLIEGFLGSFGLVGTALSSIFGLMDGSITEGWTSITSKFSNAWSGIKNVFSDAGSWFSDVFSGAWDGVKKAWNGATNFFNDIWKGIKGVFDKIKNSSVPEPKIAWDNIKNTASRTIEGIKTTVERFKANLPKPTLSWNELRKTLTDTLNNLKNTLKRFKWELPKPKLPVFSLSGGEAPWGFMGKGSLPKLSIKWNAAGGILTDAMLFGMTGNTLLGGGEAGPEAILPLDELWRQLGNHFQQQNAVLRGAVAAAANSGNNRPVNITLKINDIEMGKAVVSSLKALSDHGGSIDLPI